MDFEERLKHHEMNWSLRPFWNRIYMQK